VLALALLPPFSHVKPSTRQAISVFLSLLAIIASILFARLPLRYHVPWSAGLTYILSLTGWYGASRVIDLFFISGRKVIPRRVKRKLQHLDDTDSETEGPTVDEVTPDKASGGKKDGISE